MSNEEARDRVAAGTNGDTPPNPGRRRLLSGLALAGTGAVMLEYAPLASAWSAATMQAPDGAAAVVAQATYTPGDLQRKLSLMPWPSEVSFLGTSAVALPERIPVQWSTRASSRAKGALQRFAADMQARFHTRFPSHTARGMGTRMEISVARPGKLEVGEDESYALRVDAGGIRLDAATDLGLIHGLATLGQLLKARTADGGLTVYPVSITDQPRFAWRGLMIDCARHFQPLPVLRRNLRAMEAMKLNVLHLHLSDNQGFRVESRTLPKLIAVGSNGESYTQRQIKQLIAYAAERGILVVPEFDMPSHAVCWFVGYPELASAPGPYELYTHFGGQMASFDPTNPHVYEVLDRFYGEMSRLFESDYIHIGGDENSSQQWTFNPYIQAFMHKLHQPPIGTNTDLQAFFTNRVSRIVAQRGKTPIGWDEVLQPGVQKDIVIQSWRGNEALVAAAESGYKALLSHGYYLDLYDFTSDYYLNDPIPPGTTISADVAANILGGEAEMWSELASPDIIDSRIWPNMAAIAERLWSPSSIRDVDWMYARLRVIEQQLATLGLRHLCGPATLLEALGGTAGTATLTQFIGLVSPIRGYQRSRKAYTTTTPFTAPVDAAVTPAWGAIAFQQMVAAVRDNPDSKILAPVRTALEDWGQLAKRLRDLTRQSASLAGLAPFVPALAGIAKVGVEACGYLESGKPAPIEWARTATTAFISADQVHADLRLRVVASVRDLASLAVERGRVVISA